MMTPEQAQRALALLRSLHADIEAGRSKRGDRLEFVDFNGRYDGDDNDTLTIEWPNLAILSDQVAAFLKEIDA